jgi:hypothetical protein
MSIPYYPVPLASGATEVIVTGSAATVLTIPCDGDKDVAYILEYRILVGNVAGIAISLKMNSDATAGNYLGNYLQSDYNVGTTNPVSSLAAPQTLGNMYDNGVVYGSYIISAKTGRNRVLRGGWMNQPAAGTFYRMFSGHQIVWKNSTDNLTSVNLVAGAADMAVGSRASLYKLG